MKQEKTITCPHCKGIGKTTIPSEAETIKAYYFGCVERTGHFWFNRYLHSVRRNLIPKELINSIDSFFCPGVIQDDYYNRTRPEVVGEAAIHHLNLDNTDWTILAFWDRSVDSRRTSNSNFVAQGKFSFSDMMAIAHTQFTPIMNRKNFPEIKLVEGEDLKTNDPRCSECNEKYGCFIGKGPCFVHHLEEGKLPDLLQDVKRGLRIAWQFTNETQNCEECMADLCRIISDQRARIERLEQTMTFSSVAPLKELNDALQKIHDLSDCKKDHRGYPVEFYQCCVNSYKNLKNDSSQ